MFTSYLLPLAPRNESESVHYDFILREISESFYRQGTIERRVVFLDYLKSIIDGKCLTEVKIGQPVWIRQSARFTEIEYNKRQVERHDSRTVNIFETPAPPVTIVLTYPYSWSSISTTSSTNFAAVVTGATAPLTFSIVTGSLPAGLSLNTTTGAITGTSTTASTGTVAIKVVDSNGDTDTSPVYSWTVTAPVTIVLTYPYSWNTISTMMPTNFAAVVSGASSPLTFSIVTGSLPQGLNLNSSSGLVYGTASMLAWGTTGTVAIKVVDTNGDEDTSPTYSWAVN